MRILIDATTADPQTRIFGMSLVDRLLHSLRRSELDPEEVRVAVYSPGDSVESDHPVRSAVDVRRLGNLRVTWEGGIDSLGQRVASAMGDGAGGDWLVIAGDTIVDTRLLPQVAALPGNVFFVSGEANQRGGLLRLEAEASASLRGADLLNAA